MVPVRVVVKNLLSSFLQAANKKASLGCFFVFKMTERKHECRKQTCFLLQLILPTLLVSELV